MVYTLADVILSVTRGSSMSTTTMIPYFVCLWYSGMRIGELAGISKENIITDAAIPYFNLVHQDNRRLKNEESVRKVPIHPACLPFVERLYLSKGKSPRQIMEQQLQ